jgi:hypothetical protein
MLLLGYAYVMIVFDYMIRLYNQDVLVRATPTAAQSATESSTD